MDHILGSSFPDLIVGADKRIGKFTEMGRLSTEVDRWQNAGLRGGIAGQAVTYGL
jgi:hypothetical protein